MAQYSEHGHVDVGKSPGPKTRFNDETITAVADYALRNNFATNEDIRNHFEEQGNPRVCLNTITNYLKRRRVSSKIAAEKPMLTEEAKNSRVEASLSNLLIPLSIFRRTVFLDEFSIDSRMKRKTRVKRLKGKRFDEKNLNRYELRNPKTFSFCCCFSYHGAGPIHLIEGRFNAEKYRDFLRDTVFPYYRNLFGGDFYLLHDNARIHTAVVVRDLIETEDIRVHLHPPYSPDLNPIENLGNSLKRKVCEALKTFEARSHDDPRDLVPKIWSEFNNEPEFLERLVDSPRDHYQ